MSEAHARSIEILGIPFAERSLATAADEVLCAVVRGEHGHVCVANADMFTRALRMPRLRSAMKGALLVVSDGVPLIWLQRRLGMRLAERVYGPDFMAELCRRAQSAKVPVFFFGGTPELLQSLRALLAQRFPELLVAGSIAPPMLPQDAPFDPECISTLRQSGARLIFVGLGCPKQELWMQTHAPSVDAVMIGVGQAFSQLAGTISRAPAWMQRCGLEWVFRLVQEPRRLWKRYLVGNTIFVVVAGVTLLRHYLGQLRPSRKRND